VARARRWKRIPEEARREAIRLAARGCSLREIASELRLGQGSVQRVLQPLGGVIRPEVWQQPAGCLSLDDRVEIRLGLERGWSFERIAGMVGFHRSSVWREVGANGGRGAYAPMRAHRRACLHRRRPKPTKLATRPELCGFVVEGLERWWSPQQIARKLQAEFPDDPEMRVSHETIYKSLYVQGRGELRRELAACLRTGRAVRRPQGRLKRRGRIVGMVNISERPAEAEDRAVPGHWEGDLIIGAGGKSAVGTLVERSTRFVMLLHLPKSRSADEVREAMTAKILTLPETLRRSITWDQGHELAQHAQFRVDTGVDVYFCDPHSPWQRGSNENTNGLLRQYMPKGISLRRFSPEDLDAIADSLNSRPRQTLGWMTPSEKLNEALVASTG
jgi:transposase, IS30 family